MVTTTSIRVKPRCRRETLNDINQPGSAVNAKSITGAAIAQCVGSKTIKPGDTAGIKGDLTAVENLRFAASLDGYRLQEQRAWQILADIGLRGHEDLPTKHLSQGQKRRVALARLFANDAQLWILDEPFTALDAAAVEQLQQLIRQHVDNGGIAVVTTHQAVGLIDEQTRSVELGVAHA